MHRSYFNVAIDCFGIDLVLECMYQFYYSYNLPMISVGSGLAPIEYLFSVCNKNAKVICVDPNPRSFDPREPFIEPDYPYVKGLIKKNPRIVGNCVLFLNWCEPNESTYDYDAVIDLKPRAILTIFEFRHYLCGMAGGEKYYKWVKKQTTYNITHVVSLLVSEDTATFKALRIMWHSIDKVDAYLPRETECIVPEILGYP